MAGLLAANMLRHHETTVIEAQPELPNNHSAVLRFRSSVVGDALGIPFRKVLAMKAIHPWRNPVADVLAYAYKSTGQATMRSITTAGSAPVERYIAPPDLIAKMEKSLPHRPAYSAPLTLEKIRYWQEKGANVISTLPMPVLMKMLNWADVPDFPSRPGRNIVVKLNCVDSYVSVYVPTPELQFHRVSITGGELIIEFSRLNQLNPAREIRAALKCVGLPEQAADMSTIDIRDATYSKIMHTDEIVRKRFMIWATENFGVYSLGRFACWRPGLLLDDVVQDVRAIEKMIDHGNYDHRKA